MDTSHRQLLHGGMSLGVAPKAKAYWGVPMHGACAKFAIVGAGGWRIYQGRAPSRLSRMPLGQGGTRGASDVGAVVIQRKNHRRAWGA